MRAPLVCSALALCCSAQASDHVASFRPCGFVGMPTADNPVPTHAPAPNLTNVTIEKKKITATIQTRKKNEGITCTLLMLDNGETMIVVGTEADIHEALGW